VVRDLTLSLRCAFDWSAHRYHGRCRADCGDCTVDRAARGHAQFAEKENAVAAELLWKKKKTMHVGNDTVVVEGDILQLAICEGLCADEPAAAAAR
jgi:hypothetical protein